MPKLLTEIEALKDSGARKYARWSNSLWNRIASDHGAMLYQHSDKLLLQYMHYIQVAVGEGLITEADLTNPLSPIAVLLLEVAPTQAELLESQDLEKMWHLGRNLSNLPKNKWEIALISQLLRIFDPAQMPFQEFVDKIISESLQDPPSETPCTTSPATWAKIRLPYDEPSEMLFQIAPKVIGITALDQAVALLFLGASPKIIGMAPPSNFPGYSSRGKTTIATSGFVVKLHAQLPTVLVGKCGP